MAIDPQNIGKLKNLAGLLKTPPGQLSVLARGASGYYKKFTLPKKSGGERSICCPNRKLKAVQRMILKQFLNGGKLSPAASGFLPGKNIGDNAERHLGGTYFLSLDVEDFFPSVTDRQVYKAFRKLGFPSGMAMLLTRLATCEGRLPQGSPASPALSNLVCYRLDQRIAGLCKKRGVTYSRYADDLTFSAAQPGLLCGVKPMAERILREEGFALNHAKTRLLGPSQCRKVTGLVVGNGTAGIGRKQKRKLRAGIHRLAKKGLGGEDRAKLIQHLDGWLAFLNGADKTGYRQLMIYAALQGVDKELKVGSGKKPEGKNLLQSIFGLFKK